MKYCLVAFLALLATFTYAQQKWKVTDIGFGQFAQPNRIGNGGTAIGFGFQGEDNMVWNERDGVTRTPLLPGTVGNMRTTEVNMLDTIVGYQSVELGGGRSQRHAVMWDKTSGTRDVFSFSQGQAEASSVSDSGIIVGRAYDGASVNDAWTWSESRGFAWLQRLPGTSSAQARMVNSAGYVVGFSGGQGENAIWAPDGSVTRMQEPQGYGQTQAEDLNDLGFITGRSNGPRRAEGFLRAPDGHYAFIENPYNPDYYTWGASVNIHNEVVGRLGLGGNNQMGGFYWTAESGTLNLTDHLASGYQNWRIGSAQSINDKGQIVGWGYDNGRLTAVLLEPVVVPEPCSLLVLGGACLLIRKKKLRMNPNK